MQVCTIDSLDFFKFVNRNALEQMKNNVCGDGQISHWIIMYHFCDYEPPPHRIEFHPYYVFLHAIRWTLIHVHLKWEKLQKRLSVALLTIQLEVCRSHESWSQKYREASFVLNSSVEWHLNTIQKCSLGLCTWKNLALPDKVVLKWAAVASKFRKLGSANIKNTSRFPTLLMIIDYY